MEAKVVNTSLLGYQSAAREEDRESEGERERERLTFHKHTVKWVSIAHSRVQPLR